MLNTIELAVKPVFVPSTTGAPPLYSEAALNPKLDSVV
jgi:hypothetical protein